MFIFLIVFSYIFYILDIYNCIYIVILLILLKIPSQVFNNICIY